ncbi:MAG: hypothetical protein A2126_02885 [Candidatus Woykebacteria bacterium GWB1_45_5]|uniref:UPF0251 protein A2113_04080 n=2 Tax=Candidatus Woykeibacteriota TaxID=1817899 RepID=A0A1G1W205_9BACT|nr:MAG: hypothetical protein A2113_04080 [Candidatus Woykebacteria bacterium GWA1_44_8]OGY22194.1 MAG: hypothetical protein A2126_02885 [Candidatus Woykebacteria bacterium GWB1_45_5]
MPRPKKARFCRFEPNVYYFKPRGIPLKFLEEVKLLPDELEALRLAEVESLEQTQAAVRMRISQPTFARILAAAHQKIAAALVEGKAIRIEK